MESPKNAPITHADVALPLSAESSSEEHSTLLPFEKVKRTILVRRDAETSPKYGMSPDQRPIPLLLDQGIVNIDKPSGPSSHQVSAYVQKILGIDKSGHSGTLDPGVTGCLPCALGRATRIVQSLLNAGKEYVGIMHIHAELPRERIEETFKKFTGKIKQLPPVKSAVKRQWRYRKVYYLDLLEIEGKNVVFRAGTQAGTYIRKLVHDIGTDLGCGAHMVELRRTKAGPFNESNLVTLQDLADAFHYYREKKDESRLRACVLPFERGIDHLGKIWIFDATVDSICHGASLKVPGIAKIESDLQADDPVAILTLKGELVAVGTAQMTSAQMQSAERGIAAILSQVFMNPGTYPRMDNKAVEKAEQQTSGIKSQEKSVAKP